MRRPLLIVVGFALFALSVAILMKSGPSESREPGLDWQTLTDESARCVDAGDYDGAIAIAEKVLAAAEEGGDPRTVAKRLAQLAMLHCAQDQYAAAEPLYRRALVIRQEFFGPNHPKTIETLQDLARVERMTGQTASPDPGSALLGKVVKIRPTGALAKVDTAMTRGAMARLRVSSTRSAAIREITTAPGNYAPPALYALASAMFAAGKKNESLFWFYLGQLRARSDASKCGDVSARQAVQVLNMQHGAPINQFAFKDVDRLRKVVDQVLEWDRTHPRRYDPQWISLHGLAAFTGESDKFAEKSRWAGIDTSTRDKYREAFEKSLVLFVKLKAEMDTDGDGVVTDGEREASMEKKAKEQDKEWNEALRKSLREATQEHRKREERPNGPEEVSSPPPIIP